MNNQLKSGAPISSANSVTFSLSELGAWVQAVRYGLTYDFLVRKYCQSVGLGLLMLLLPLSHAEQSVYVEGAFGAVQTNWDRAHFLTQLDNVTQDARIRKFDNDRHGYSLAMGFQVKPRVAVEMGYQDWGKVTLDLDATVSDDEPLKDLLDKKYPLSGQGPFVSTRLSYFDSDNAELFVKLGLWVWQGNYRTRIDTRIERHEKNGIDLLFSAGCSFKIHEKFRLGAMYSTAQLDNQTVGNVQILIARSF